MSAVTAPGALHLEMGNGVGKKGSAGEKNPSQNGQVFAPQVAHKLTAPGWTEDCRQWSKPEPLPSAMPALLPVCKCLCFQSMPPELTALYWQLCHQPRTPLVTRPRCQGCTD